jgi:ubiquinol-cytochrome c reductase cytochrome b subunit
VSPTYEKPGESGAVLDHSSVAGPDPKDPLANLPGPAGVMYRWLDDRLGINAVIRPILVHPVPRSTNWFNVLGSATLTAFIFQVVTGIFLSLVYVPAPNDAYKSLQWITDTSYFGHLLRGIHYWGGSAMILLIFAHTARVFLTGSYKYPRELNWLLGVGLLFLTILMGFTGQLLVWNQDSYWAIVVGAEQAARTPFIGPLVAQILLAGQVVNGTTLTHFFAIHVFIVPAVMGLLIAGHLYLVIYQGISEWPEPSAVVDPKTYKEKYHKILEDGIPFFPDAMAKDAIFAAFAGLVVLLLAIRFGGAPLGHPADPTNVVTNPRPFWFLIWYFALLAEIPSSIENIVIIGFPAAIVTWMLLLPFYANKGERAPSKRPWAVGSVFIAVLATAELIYMGYQSPWSPVFTDTGQLKTVPPNIVANLHGPARAGAQVFHDMACIACHQVGGVGGIRGPALDNVYSQFTEPRLVIQIAVGGLGTGYQAMPAFGPRMSSTQMDEMIAFLRQLPAVEKKASSQVAAPTIGKVSAPLATGVSPTKESTKTQVRYGKDSHGHIVMFLFVNKRLVLTAPVKVRVSASAQK